MGAPSLGERGIFGGFFPDLNRSFFLGRCSSYRGMSGGDSGTFRPLCTSGDGCCIHLRLHVPELMQVLPYSLELGIGLGMTLLQSTVLL